MKYFAPRFLFRRYEILQRVKKGVSFVEVGPGQLNLAQDLLDYFERGTVVDFNPEVRRYYDSLTPDHRARLSLLVADFSAMALQERFDCFLACEVLEHIRDDDSFLERAYDLLKAGGQLVLSVPARTKYWSYHDEAVGHLRRYERKQLYDLIWRAGFSEIEIIAYGYPFVNLLRLPRIVLARLQQQKTSQLDQKVRTQRSGFNHAPTIFQGLAFLSNRHTVFPLAVLASLFNSLDLSEAYLVTAVAQKDA
jgi:SAM-dependent methyltransferase